MTKEEIFKKLDSETPLTKEEEMFYLTEILGHSEEEAARIIEIAENKDENKLID